MSGFVGILNLDGKPVDSRLLRELTDFLSFRGPAAQEIWFAGSVGFGHTLLDATRESQNERQPFTLDGITWIVADARVDARNDLIAALGQNAGGSLAEATDAELILRSYHLWGQGCVEHLLGDFSFAIWDARHRRLFCARDQLGVKPFFYASLGACFVFSNTLECIRRHPFVSSQLDDLAIADFLLFDMSQDPAATAFAKIRRLPAAHALLCDSGDPAVRRYWDLPHAKPLAFRREEDCVERFRELFDVAVEDRLRGQSAGVLMSGGLDSTTVAAAAQRVFLRGSNPSGLRAYTMVFDRLIPHEERRYAGMVAESLGIPIEFRADDDLELFARSDRPEFYAAEPGHCAIPNTLPDQLRQVSSRTRVALTGLGADPAFSSRITMHFRRLLKTGHFGRAMADALQYLTAEKRLARLYLRTRWRILFSSNGQSPLYPAWLNPNLEKKLSLRERWEGSNRPIPPVDSGRPGAREAVLAPLWPDLFETYDAGRTRVPVDVRHPFFDLRLLNFVLALPALPWCSDKQLLREAARGVLPEAVRLRRKSPLAADPLVALLERPEAAWVDRFDPEPDLSRYVAVKRIPSVLGEKDPWRAWIHLRPLSLNFWLRQFHGSRTNRADGSDRRELVCSE